MRATAWDEPQRAARVVGFVYLFAMAMSMFTEMYVRGSLIVGSDAVQTAENVAANATLFRLGIAGEMLTFAADIALIAASFVILAPASRSLALFAAFIRLAAETVGAMLAAHGFDVLRILSGAPYMQAFDSAEIAALARLSLGGHAAAYGVMFVFLGIGSAVFAFLWLRSGYVPALLARIGVVGSILLVAGSLVALVFPTVKLFPWHMLPMFVFEVGMGIVLLVRGLRVPPPAVAPAGGDAAVVGVPGSLRSAQDRV